MAASEDKKTTKRSYVVLKQPFKPAEGNPSEWVVVGVGQGINDKQAIDAAVDDPNQEGVFVAIPERSWRPVRRQVQVVPKTLWS